MQQKKNKILQILLFKAISVVNSPGIACSIFVLLEVQLFTLLRERLSLLLQCSSGCKHIKYLGVQLPVLCHCVYLSKRKFSDVWTLLAKIIT